MEINLVAMDLKNLGIHPGPPLTLPCAPGLGTQLCLSDPLLAHSQQGETTVIGPQGCR